MKKIKLFTFLVSIYFIGVLFVSAAGNASLSVSSSKIENGSSVKATVTVSNTAAWNIKIISSGATNGCTQTFADATSDGKNATKSFTVTCKASSTGIINFVLAGDITSSDGTNTKVSGSKSVTVVPPREKSTNNKLKSLSVEGYEISPKFDSSIKEYTVTVPADVEKIKISANKADSYASVNGTGEKNVEEGVNVFEIVVTSETGVSNTYKLTVNVEDQNPIEVTVDGKKYTLVKLAKNLEKPELFEETTVKIEDYDIPAFVNSLCDYTLVGLKDETGIIKLFLYEDGKYFKFNEFLTDKLSLVFLKMEKLPSNYKKTTITLNQEKIEAYRTSTDSKALIYAVNLSTGKKNYYTYDSSEKTFQIFDVDNYEKSIVNEKNNQYLIYGLSGATLLSFVLVILFASKSNKMKKLVKLMEESLAEKEDKKTKKKKGD